MQIITDISYYSGKVDFGAMKTAGAAGTLIRAGQRDYADTMFSTYWSAAKGILPRGSYWFFDSRTEPEAQAVLWASLIKDDPGELPNFLDLEESYGGPYAGYNGWYRLLVKMQTLIPGINLGIYTGFYYFRDAPMPVESRQWFKKFPLWLAQYTAAAGPVLMPPWDDWMFWQYTAHGHGPDYGQSGMDIDLNYVNPSFVIPGAILPPSDDPQQNPTVPAPVVVPPVVSLMRVKDDAETPSTRPYTRVGLPPTVRIQGSTGNKNLTPPWFAYWSRLNPTQMNYLTKDHSGWHNTGDKNNVVDVTFAGNVVPVTQIENGRAHISHYSMSDTPPLAVRPTAGNLSLPVQFFTTGYADHTDISTDGRWPLTFLIGNPGDDLYMDARDLSPYTVTNVTVKITTAVLRVRMGPYVTAKQSGVKFWNAKVQIIGITLDNFGNVWGRLPDMQNYIALKYQGQYMSDWRG